MSWVRVVVECLCFRMQGFEFGVSGVGFRVKGLFSRVWVRGLGFGGSGLMFQDLGFMGSLVRVRK
jgi:hypothetical protein